MNPESLQRLFDDWTRIWTAPAGGASVPNPLADDQRFKDPAWTATPYGQLLLRWYQATGQTAQQIECLGEALPPHQRQVWDFYGDTRSMHCRRPISS